MKAPTQYQEGYAIARQHDPRQADRYMAHTTIGDPIADRAAIALTRLDSFRSEQTIRNAMDGASEGTQETPEEVASLFADAGRAPPWVDVGSLGPASRFFFRHANAALGAMLAGVLVEGFSTNIANSFVITGRLIDQGVRRLQQNNHHLIEIFMPGGMTRDGEGWKLSVRLRLVHARVRILLADSEDWDHEAWGTPLSAAHMGFAIAAFSARLLTHMERLGARPNRSERRAFMDTWRYAGYLMGVPDAILFTDEDDANRILETGRICEPEPDLESIIMAHALINSAPLVLDMTEPAQRRAAAQHIFKVSRALIGNDLADQLRLPPSRTLGTLTWLKTQAHYNSLMSRWFPALMAQSRFESFTDLLRTATFAKNGISYRLPNHVYAERSDPW